MTVRTYSLLGDLSAVPAEYKSAVAQTKRFLERWTMDPSFRTRYGEDPTGALADLGLTLTPAHVHPFVDRDEASRVSRAIRAGEPTGVPDSVVQYRAFLGEKIAHRTELRANSYANDPRLAAWRRRQIRRAQSELGQARSDAIVHAPMAIELSKGCTVGCWFCGVAAPKFDHNFAYTPENATLWRETLQVLDDVLGRCAQNGFLYWATDPLDNPDYESFLTDFHAVLGRCPQTTTAQGPKDIERTRALLRRAYAMGSSIDRFSVIALNHLYRLHENFTPEEMLRIECVPQNKEASPNHLKSNAGRARRFAAKRAEELVGEEKTSTIACVSGFLFNMVDRRVQLITPCNASDRWPLGYWVLDEGHFDSGAELREVVETMLRRSVRTHLQPGDAVTVRPDLTVDGAGGELSFQANGVRVRLGAHPDLDTLVPLLTEGGHTAEEIALRRQRRDGIQLARTYALLGEVFDAGLLDEEPAGHDFDAVMRKPVPVSIRTSQTAGTAAG
jgi:radical SAM family RiPP maturation amino acid epimerase